LPTKQWFGNALPKAMKTYSKAILATITHTVQWEGFVTAHNENQLGQTWRLFAINICYRHESWCDELVVAMLRLLGHFHYLQEAEVFLLKKIEFDRLGIFW